MNTHNQTSTAATMYAEVASRTLADDAPVAAPELFGDNWPHVLRFVPLEKIEAVIEKGIASGDISGLTMSRNCECGSLLLRRSQRIAA